MVVKRRYGIYTTQIDFKSGMMKFSFSHWEKYAGALVTFFYERQTPSVLLAKVEIIPRRRSFYSRALCLILA